MTSLRSRLYRSMLIVMAPLLAITGLAMGWTITSWMEREFDWALEAKARALVSLTEQVQGQVELNFAGEFMPEFETAKSPEYFELWLGDGTLFERSDSFELAAGAIDERLIRNASPSAAPGLRDVRLPDGRRGRQIQIDFVPQIETVGNDDEEVEDDAQHAEPALDPAAGMLAPGVHTASLIVAREREDLDRQILFLYLAFGAVALLLFLGFGILTGAILRSALRPLDSLVTQVRGLNAKSLGTRVQVEAPPREIVPIIDQLNALFSRIEAAFMREQQLSDNIAHELKTPVAELRSLCEVGGRWPEDTDAAKQFFNDARVIALQMHRLITNLLLLARFEKGEKPVQNGTVGIAKMIDTAWHPLIERARAKNLTLCNDVSSTVRLATDSSILWLLVSNLLSNAVAYSVPGSTIHCTAEQNDGRFSLAFLNRAANLEQQDLAVMFDRFWRKDDARTGGANVGTGLTPVRAFADHLGFEIETSLDADKVFRLRFTQRPVAGRSIAA